jgi:hypothetical protein
MRRDRENAAKIQVRETPVITHRFTLDRLLDAYKTFGHAVARHALKVPIAT